MSLAIATTSAAPEQSPIRLVLPGVRDRTIAVEPATAAATRRRRLRPGWLEDAGLLLLLVLTFPVVVLMVGAPVALVIRLLIQVAGRL